MIQSKNKGLINILADPKSIIGILISIGGIYWAFRDFHFAEFTASIQEVKIIYLVGATFLLWGSVWLRAFRWRWLFKKENSPSTSSLYRAELIGYFGNNVLPLRLGELLRSYIVGKENHLSKSFVIGTVVLERLMDMLALISLALLLLLIYPLEESIRGFVLWRGLITIFTLTIILFILYKIKRIKANHKILKILNQIIDGLLSIRKEKVIPVILSSLLIWCIYWMDVFLLQRAFQFNLSWAQVLMVLVISSVALSIPSAPGMIGTFHAAVKYTMVDLFAYSPIEGNSFAILMHAYGYILLTLLGAYFFMRSQFHKNAIKNVITGGSSESKKL